MAETGPARRDLLVGVDLGSQSAKVVVYDLAGVAVAQGTRALRPAELPAPGNVVHPGDDLWEATAAACREAMDTLGERRHRIAAVGLCGVRFCRALLAEDGSLVEPVLSWMDDRVSRPYQPGPHADRVARVTAASGLLTHRLTGRFRDSAAAYRGQWPISDDGWSWHPDDAVVRGCGLRRDQLAELVVPGEVLGEVTDAASRATGLPAGLPVVATANDKAVEALGSGLRRPGDLLLSLGTYIAAMTPGHDQRSGASYWTNVASVPGEYLRESEGIRRGMWTVSWLRDLLGSSEDALDAAAVSVPPGASGLLTVTDWLAPVDRPWRAGAFVGLDATHGPAHLWRSLLEGIALTMVTHVEAMLAELEVVPGRLLVCGGGARSAVLPQVLADAFRLPVHRPVSPGAASLGAAICAAVGAGLLPSYDEACAAMVRTEHLADPTDEGVQAYRRLGELRSDLIAALEPVLRKRAGL